MALFNIFFSVSQEPQVRVCTILSFGAHNVEGISERHQLHGVINTMIEYT